MKKLKKIILNLNVLVVLGLLVGLLLPLVVAPQPVSAQSWLSDYAYRQKFSLSREDGAVSNYTMVMTVNKGAGTSLNQTIYLDSHADNWTASIPNDIRFTQSDGTTLLDYGVLTSNTTAAKVAVEFNSIGVNPTNFYCYYGKSDAADGGDLEGFSKYGDDFNRANSDTVGVGWVEAGTGFDIDIASNRLQVNYDGTGTAPPNYGYHNYTFDSNVTVSVYTQAPTLPATSDQYTWIIADDDPGTGGEGLWGLTFIRDTGPVYNFKALRTGGWSASLGTFTPGNWYEFEFKYDYSVGKLEFFIDGVSVDGPSLGYGSASWVGETQRIAITGGGDPATNWINDNIYVRPWVTPEPDWEVWYAEESSGISVTTNSESNVGTTTATLNGNLGNMGGYSPIYCYFQYGTTTSYGINTTEQAKYVTGDFDQGLTDLIPATIYHYRAAIRYNTNQYAYGSDETFITDAEGDWYSTYQHRQSFNLTKTTTRTDFPVQFTVHKGTGTSTGSTIYLQNQALSWTSTVPNDLRFTTSGQVPLDYWIESSTTTQAVVWVEANSISSTPATFHVYYGKSGDTTTSNIANTFTFGDDFESYSIGVLSTQSTWNDISSVQITEQTLVEDIGEVRTIDVGFNDRRPYVDLASGSGATEGRAVVARVYCEGGTPDGMGIPLFSGTAGPTTQIDINGYNFIYFGWFVTYDAIMRADGTADSWVELDKDADTTSIGVWSQLEARWYSTNLKLLVDGIEISTTTDATYSSREHLGFSSSGGGRWNVDWVFVRQFDGETVTVDSWVAEGGTEVPTLTTGAVSGFLPSSATFWGGITNIGDSSVVERGFDYGGVYDPFTIVVIPDTQNLAGAYIERFTAMTQWIANNKEVYNIVAVLHVGDLTGDASDARWADADTGYAYIDAMGVPYITTPGNHDYDGDAPASRGLTKYATHFGSARFGGYDWWNAGNMAGNSYILFEGGGIKFIAIGLQFGPSDTDLAWARGILDNNPDRLAIIVTHNYMYYDDTRAAPPDSWDPKVNYSIADANNGEEMWTELVSQYSNIVAVYSGHVLGDGVGKRTDYVDGEPINQAIQNWQYGVDAYPIPGRSYCRFYTFTPNDNLIEAWTYSPYVDNYLTDSQNQFTWPFRVSVGGYESFAYSKTEIGTFGTGTYSLVITGLEVGQTYGYRATARNTEGWGYGSTKYFLFTGAGEEPPEPPYVPPPIWPSGGTVMYEYWNTDDDADVDIYGDNWFGQTFVTGSTLPHTISQIRARLFRVGSPGILTVYVYETSEGKPTDQPIGEGSISADGLTTSVSGVWYSITLDEEISLQTGTTYAVVLEARGGTASDYVSWRYDSGNGYAGGTEVSSTSGGISWSIIGANDMMFEIWGVPAIRILDVKVFESLYEDNDQLFLFSYQVFPPTGYEDTLPTDYFHTRLLVGSTLEAQGKLPAWGYKPGGFYLNANSAIPWGVNTTTIRITGITGSGFDGDEAGYTLTDTDWVGEDLNALDDWIISTANAMGTWYGVTLVGASTSGAYLLTPDGGVLFTIGIPGIENIRPGIFSTQGYTEVPEKEDYDTSYSESLIGGLGTRWTDAVDDIGDLLGVSGELVGGTLWIYIMVLGLSVAGVGLGSGPVPLICAGLPLAFLGGNLGAVPLEYILLPVFVLGIFAVLKLTGLKQ